MTIGYLPNVRICTVCKKDFTGTNRRWDAKTCSGKCRQQAYRNRLRAAEDLRYAEQRQARHQLEAIRDKRNAARRKARRSTKHRTTIPMKDLCTLHKKSGKATTKNRSRQS